MNFDLSSFKRHLFLIVILAYRTEQARRDVASVVVSA